MNIDEDSKTVELDPRNSDFFGDPYPYYAAIQAACPAFYWNNYHMWCFSSFEAVNKLLRDKRFGHQILHVATRQEAGLPEPKPHLAQFDAIEEHSLLELEPPAHTRLRTLVNRAFVSRQEKNHFATMHLCICLPATRSKTWLWVRMFLCAKASRLA